MTAHARTVAILLLTAALVAPRPALADDPEPTSDTGTPAVAPPPGPPPAAARAAAAGGPTASEKAQMAVGKLLTRELVLDLSVPESPAFAVLGFTPERVVRPTSPRELAANLLNGVDQRGNLQTGIALDTTPYLLFRGSEVTLQAYRNDYLTRLAARTQFSLATTKGTSDDDEAVRLGLGLKTTLWDAGDPRRDREFTECLMGAHELVHASLDELLDKEPEELLELGRRLGSGGDDPAVLPIDTILLMNQQAAKEAAEKAGAPEAARQPAAGGAGLQAQILRKSLAERLGDDDFGQEYTERILLFLSPEGKLRRGQEITTSCFEQAKARNWNRPSWDLGTALSWLSDDGDIENLASSGGAVWTSLALNLPDETWWNLRKDVELDESHEDYLSDFVREHFQLVLHARYRPEEEVPDGDGNGTTTQDTTIVGGRLRMGTPEWAFSAEVAYTHIKASGMSGDDSTYYAVGGEYRITDDLWLQVSVGSESGNDVGGDEASILGSIKYGFSSGSPFDTWSALKTATP